MNEQRWFWQLMVIALALILASTATNGGWIFLGGLGFITGAGYFFTRFAMRHGYKWRRNRAGGFIMLAVMLIVLLMASQVTASFELGALLAAACGFIVISLVSLRRAN